jgi:hypothetical protein
MKQSRKHNGSLYKVSVIFVNVCHFP